MAIKNKSMGPGASLDIVLGHLTFSNVCIFVAWMYRYILYGGREERDRGVNVL